MALPFSPITRLEQAPAARGRLARGPESRRREFSRLPSTALRIQWSRRTRAPGKPDLPIAATRLRELSAETAAAKGNALRVSLSCAFQARLRTRAFPASRPATDVQLRWREMSNRACAVLPAAAAPKTCGSLPIPSGGVFCPPPPEHSGVHRPVSRITSFAAPPVNEGAALQTRSAAARWAASNESLALPRAVFQPRQAAGYGSLPHIAIKLTAAGGRGESRHSRAPFVPQDIGYSFNVGQNGSKDQKR